MTEPSWKNNFLWYIPIIAILFFIWQGINGPEILDFGKNITNSRMTYGRFLEYVDMGWIKKVDLYDDGHTAIIEAIGPELGNRIQRIRVELPTEVPELVGKLRKANIDIDAHPIIDNSSNWGVGNNIAFPIILIISIVFLFRKLSELQNGTGQAMNFTKSNARFSIEAKTDINFNDVAGVDEAKEEFQEVVSFLRDPKKFITIGATVPKGVILVGPPGTGKTLLAKAISGEAGVPFFSISGSEFVETFVGIGASRVRDLFKKAKENSPCIIFIDEIDAVGRQRGTGIGGGSDEREQTLNQLLTEMDGFEVSTSIVVIAATNRIDVLDSALLRPGRFDRQVTVNLPDIKGRVEILKVHARNKQLEEDILIGKIAKRTPGFSGADLANLLNEAAILGVRRRKECITMSEIETAMDRVIAGIEGIILMDSRSKKRVAYHEIGHAIIGTLLADHDPVQKVTLVPRGQAKGLTWFNPSEEQQQISRSQIIAQIMGVLGGRVAEEVVFGYSEVTSGAGTDLQQATSMARQMVTKFGMSNIGPIYLESQTTDPFLGRTIKNSEEYSEDITSKIDMQIRHIIYHCHNAAIQIIKDNRTVIDTLTDILIENETMTGDEFRDIVQEFTDIPQKHIHSTKM
jgi:cell division protease FtsH